jgi:hypothetical protein
MNDQAILEVFTVMMFLFAVGFFGIRIIANITRVKLVSRVAKSGRYRLNHAGDLRDKNGKRVGVTADEAHKMWSTYETYSGEVSYKDYFDNNTPIR